MILPTDSAPEDQGAGAILFDQQMWCWGQDIRRPEGNALLLYGLERDAPPPESRLGPVYHLSPTPGARLILARQRFSPCLLRRATFPDPCWKAHAVPPHRPPETAREWQRARLLMSQALSWTADYEAWVWREIGPDHRRKCVADWFKQTVPAETMAAEWRTLARLYEAETTQRKTAQRKKML